MYNLHKEINKRVHDKANKEWKDWIGQKIEWDWTVFRMRYGDGGATPEGYWVTELDIHDY